MAREIEVAGNKLVLPDRPLPDRERVHHHHNDDILPPNNREDVVGYFVRRDFEGRPENGYGEVAWQVMQVIERLVSDDDGTTTKSQKGDLMLAPGHLTLRDEIPEASRALIEMTYALVGGETTDKVDIKGRTHIFVDAVHGGKPLQFVETYTETNGHKTMEWAVRTNDPKELAEEQELKTQPLGPYREESLNFYETTLRDIDDVDQYLRAA